MLIHWDAKRDLAVPGDAAETIAFAVDHWLKSARAAIEKKGRFAVALSGGSTPKAIFEKLAEKPTALDWSRVLLFWSDERAVPPDHPDSNYKMALDAGFSKLPIPSNHIFRMKAETHIEQHALEYEKTIRRELGPSLFDLVMLGVGEDGHTASLFPGTTALDIQDRLVVANHIPQKNTWRMTFTFPCINQSALAVIYALGASKQEIVPQALKGHFPSSHVGTQERKALWILDKAASKEIIVN
ncbi:MAG: 6-phosphogluconolactonase [Verrucomicrobia bacterium]|nr:6-phosphogluconolactonase [Verrucomicrobiota bacterium]